MRVDRRGLMGGLGASTANIFFAVLQAHCFGQCIRAQHRRRAHPAWLELYLDGQLLGRHWGSVERAGRRAVGWGAESNLAGSPRSSSKPPINLSADHLPPAYIPFFQVSPLTLLRHLSSAPLHGASQALLAETVCRLSPPATSPPDTLNDAACRTSTLPMERFLAWV